MRVVGAVGVAEAEAEVVSVRLATDGMQRMAQAL